MRKMVRSLFTTHPKHTQLKNKHPLTIQPQSAHLTYFLSRILPFYELISTNPQ